MMLNQGDTRQENVVILTHLEAVQEMALFLNLWLYETVLLPYIN